MKMMIILCFDYYNVAAQQIVSLEIINSPSPLQVFDNFVSSLVSSVYFLPFIVPLNMVQWLSDCFRELDHCVWAAMSRYSCVEFIFDS